MNDENKEYVVYEHWLDGKCFYVGSGSIYRSKHITRSVRSKEWLNIAWERRREVQIKIVFSSFDKIEVRKFERDHMKKYDNLCNKTSYDENLFKGEKNPMYGSDRSGEKNPMYGRKGKNHPRYGYKLSDMEKDRLSKSKMRKSVATNKETNEKYFFSSRKEAIQFFAKEKICGSTGVSNHLNGKPYKKIIDSKFNLEVSYE